MKKRGRPQKYIGISNNVRKLYNSKKGLKKIDIYVFKDWFEKQKDSCAYCGITTEESVMLFNKYPEATRKGRRGKRLEIDRIDPKITDYGADINNLALSCYWCNNAKTNYFSFDEFKLIGKTLGEIQKVRLSRIDNL